MSADRYGQAWELFHEALARPEPQRLAFVDERCGEDAELRQEVLGLLARDAAPGSFLAVPAIDRGAEPTRSLDEPAPKAGRVIGRYEIRGAIGSGGMGTVYEAVQDDPRRLVALKLLRRDAASRSAMKRFRHEAAILGRLRHPNIAQIYEAGTWDEGGGARPYFAMELLKGRPLTTYCASGGLGTRQRLQLFAKVCDAVQYAHHKGVIHRDLKPDNILVDDLGEPKILDFGVARATDSDIQATTLRTDIGQLIGTVPYMSPEQVTGDPTELDTRSDVYSLGVVLYELLAGRLPHELRDKNIPEAVRVIREDDPTPLSSVNRIFRGDLETIAAKALEKERDRRYQTAAELAAEVRRYLADEPIVARPPSTFYHLRKFARRNKVLVGGVVTVFAVLVAGLVGISLSQAEVKREAEKAHLINRFLEEALSSPDPIRWGQRDVTVAELLDDAAEKIDSRFASHPDIAARLHLTIGKTYHGLGRINEAQEQVRQAYEEGRRHLGQLDETTLSALACLTDTMMKQSRYDEALPLAREYHESRRQVYGDDDLATLKAVELLGWALSGSTDRNDRANAEILLRREADRSSRVHGSHAMTWRLKNVLANLLIRQYEFDEAEPLTRWLIDWCDERPRQAHQATRPMTDRAFLLGWRGDPDRGAVLGEEALQRRLDLYGPNHPQTRTSLRIVGLNEQWAGRLDEAERFFERCVSASSGDEPNLTYANFLLARLRMLQGNLKPAEALSALEVLAPEPADPILPFWGEMALTANALCLARLGRSGEAEQLLRRHPGELMDAVAPDHYERRLYLTAWLEIYESLDRPEKAAEYRKLLRAAEGTDEAD